MIPTIPSGTISHHNHLSFDSETIEFCSKITMPNITGKLGVVDAGYYATGEGCYGYMGSNCDNSISIPFSKKRQLLILQFDTSNLWIENNKVLLDKLYKTPGEKGTATSWSKTQKYETIKKRYSLGYYKKSIFDEVFNFLSQKLESIKTPKDLATYNICKEYKSFNEDFVELREKLLLEGEEFIEDKSEDCFKSYERIKSESVICDNVFIINIYVIIRDLEVNNDLLLQILNGSYTMNNN